MNNNYYEDFASFATRRFRRSLGIEKVLLVIKILNILYFNLSVYITRDFSLPLAIEMYGKPFFSGHPYIESTTVLSDTCTCKLHVHEQYVLYNS